MAWLDDFSTDHFAGGRYSSFGGAAEGTTFTVAPAALSSSVCQWTDPTDTLVPPFDTHINIADAANIYIVVLGLIEPGFAHGFYGGVQQISPGVMGTLAVGSTAADPADNFTVTPPNFAALSGPKTFHVSLDAAGLLTWELVGGPSWTHTVPPAMMAALGAMTMHPIVEFDGESFLGLGGSDVVASEWAYSTPASVVLPSTVVAGPHTVGLVRN